MKFWKNKRVFITGHTGFKGSWLCLLLYTLGAKVTGYALKPPTNPNLFELSNIDEFVGSVIADIRDLPKLKTVLKKSDPQIIIHMAAQPLVRDSYKVPVETYEINVMGTVNILEAARSCKNLKSIVNVTTDKVYENTGKKTGYRESEPLGGYDPYSSSKACSEIVSSAYRRSFVDGKLATARAGNVIGGGDFASDRLIPDFIKAILGHKTILIRNPKAIRPWQHVLEPLSGYLLLAEKLYKHGQEYASSWNFGPNELDSKSVEWLIKILCGKWGDKASYKIDRGSNPHEAHYLMLDSTKSKKNLGWMPKWPLDYALDKIIEWTKAYKNGLSLRRICFNQIEEYYEKKGD